jgi:hypothetical protein
MVSRHLKVGVLFVDEFVRQLVIEQYREPQFNKAQIALWWPSMRPDLNCSVNVCQFTIKQIR